MHADIKKSLYEGVNALFCFQKHSSMRITKESSCQRVTNFVQEALVIRGGYVLKISREYQNRE